MCSIGIHISLMNARDIIIGSVQESDKKVPERNKIRKYLTGHLKKVEGYLMVPAPRHMNTKRFSGMIEGCMLVNYENTN